MSERLTKANLEARAENLNRRMGERGSIYRYGVEYRYGYVAIDRCKPNGTVVDTVRAGMTKNECGEFLHAMMVALDDAAYTVDRYARETFGEEARSA